VTVQYTGYRRTLVTCFVEDNCISTASGKSLSLGDFTRYCTNTIVLQTTDCERILVTYVLNSHLKTVLIPDAALIHFVLLKMNIIVLETCRESIVNVLK